MVGGPEGILTLDLAGSTSSGIVNRRLEVQEPKAARTSDLQIRSLPLYGPLIKSQMLRPAHYKCAAVYGKS